MRKVFFLCHPSHRWQRKFPSILEEIRWFPGIEAGIFHVNCAQTDSTEILMDRAISQGYSAVVSVGGDGSLNRIVNYLGKKNLLSKITLGLMPFGTCNDFAKYLGLRRGEWKRVLQAIVQGKTRKFKVARVNRHLFINNSGFGRQAPAKIKSNLIKDIRSLKPVHAKIFFENRKVEGNFMMMVCANAPYFSGGLHFSLDSNPGDSLLEFFFVGKMGKLKLVRKLILGKRGRPLMDFPEERAILRIQTSKLTMEMECPIWVMRDGETAGDLSGVRRVAFETDGECEMFVP